MDADDLTVLEEAIKDFNAGDTSGRFRPPPEKKHICILYLPTTYSTKIHRKDRPIGKFFRSGSTEVSLKKMGFEFHDPNGRGRAYVKVDIPKVFIPEVRLALEFLAGEPFVQDKLFASCWVRTWNAPDTEMVRSDGLVPSCLQRPLGLLSEGSFLTLFVNEKGARKYWVRKPVHRCGWLRGPSWLLGYTDEKTLGTTVFRGVRESHKKYDAPILKALHKQVTNSQTELKGEETASIRFVGRIPRTGFHPVGRPGKGCVTGDFEPVICTSYMLEVPAGFTPKAARWFERYELCSAERILEYLKERRFTHNSAAVFTHLLLRQELAQGDGDKSKVRELLEKVENAEGLGKFPAD